MPGNLIAPFYADLIIADSNGQYGNIRYGNGGDPCQYIVEWDSLGTFDATGPILDNTTFRVILNRCDGTIKFEYNLVGVSGQDSAALVGMQADSNSVTAGYAGVDGIAQPGYVFLNRNAYPIETKPTPGTCITFTPGIALYANASWNLLSVSNTPVGSYAKKDVYPGAVSDAFKYTGSYKTENPLIKGRGYWLRYTQRTYAGVPGTPFTSVTDSLNPGTAWNMIGTPSKPVSTTSGITPNNATVISQYFGYNGSGYTIASTLLPGRGYWSKATTSGPNPTLLLTGSVSLPKETPVEDELSQMNKITVRDAQGGEQTLYLGNESTMKAATLSSYEMPPSMYEVSGFDARYSSGRMVEAYPATFAKDTRYEYPVSIQTNAYPITINWERAKGTPADMKAAIRNQQGEERYESPMRA
jgi:hypothetical protein